MLCKKFLPHSTSCLSVFLYPVSLTLFPALSPHLALSHTYKYSCWGQPVNCVDAILPVKKSHSLSLFEKDYFNPRCISSLVCRAEVWKRWAAKRCCHWPASRHGLFQCSGHSKTNIIGARQSEKTGQPSKFASLPAVIVKSIFEWSYKQRSYCKMSRKEWVAWQTKARFGAGRAVSLREKEAVYSSVLVACQREHLDI